MPAVEEVLDLGETALANKFRTETELASVESRFPLRLGFCHTCSHVQLMDRVPPEAMFDDYLYVSAASDTLWAHLNDLSDTLTQRHALTSDDLVIDVGANDGTLLKGFRRHGVRTLGVDPAQNLAELTSADGDDRMVAFFGAEAAPEIVKRWGRATIVTATNTFPHIPNLDDFVRGVDMVLADDGAFVIEAHYLVDMLEQCAFDTVYHEHVSYWALQPMMRLFERSGMAVVDAERLPIHHGQLRATIKRDGHGSASSRVRETLEAEREAGVGGIDALRAFATNTLTIKRDLTQLLRDLRAAGKSIAGYGAPAKGNTLLSFLELGPQTIAYIADRSDLKQGLYTPNAPIPVVPPERLLEDQPDYVLLLAWNFADEILAQQDEYRRRGGRFIVPVPTVRVIE